MVDVDAAAAPGKTKDRSPSFPFISLSAAAARLEAFEAKFGRHPAPASKAGLAWSMKESSSQALQTLAALKAFGMLDYHGSNAARMAYITDEGRAYLRASGDAAKRDVLKRLALKPKVLAQYWQDWKADRPIDDICIDQLILKGAFTHSAARTFLRVYDETMSYAGLSDFDSVAPVTQTAEGGGEDRGRDNASPSNLPRSLGLKGKGALLVEGERILQDGILSREATYRIVVSGKIGAREIERLISKLELDKEILTEADDEEDEER